jgi:hypothetical protein
VHVSKKHVDKESQNNENSSALERKVIVEEKGDNFEIKRQSDEDEDSSMESRKEGPMSITFSEMNIIGPLATLLVKVRRKKVCLVFVGLSTFLSLSLSDSGTFISDSCCFESEVYCSTSETFLSLALLVISPEL